MRMPHLVAFERSRPPRPRQSERQHGQQRPQHRAPGIGPARAIHPEPHAAPHRARQAVATRAIDRELAERVERDQQRNAGEALVTLGLHSDEKVGKVDRDQDGHREQEADQELLAATGIFGGIAVDRCVDPQVPANVGGQPEPVEPERNQFDGRTAADQSKELAARAGESDRERRKRRRLLRNETHLVHGSRLRHTQRHAKYLGDSSPRRIRGSRLVTHFVRKSAGKKHRPGRHANKYLQPSRWASAGIRLRRRYGGGL